MAVNEQLNTQQTTTAQNPSTAVRNTNEGAGSVNSYVQSYAQSLGGGVDHTNDITNMYNSALQGNLAQLETANQINNANLEANRADLQKNYTQALNTQAADYERNRMNLNTQLAGNGMNVGTGSQAALAMNSANQQAMGAINAAKVKAEDDLNRQISNLNIQYQGDIAAAIANNDYEKAAALYNDKLQREQQLTSYYKMAMQEAEQRAAVGDFSAYAGLYGQDMANQAQVEWQRQRDYEDQQRQQQQAAYELEMEQARWKQALQDAQNRAQYGDFGAYAQLYGQEAANLAKQVWARQYPDIAYDQGYLTPNEYKNITGKYPTGYSAGSTGTGGTNQSWYSTMVDYAKSRGISVQQAIDTYHAAQKK